MLKILFYIFLLGLNTHSFAQMIRVYSGPGACPDHFPITCQTLRQNISDDYTITTLSQHEILNEDWEATTSLLVIPGGADLPFVEILNGKGNERIRRYVENGGGFLGFCAGAYYAGNYVDFAAGSPLEVKGKRELAFFPGIVQGPYLSDYDPWSKSGARAAAVLFDYPEPAIAYYNGGGYFVDAENLPGIEVIGYYAERNKPAIVKCAVEKGKAILSSVHLDFDSKFLDHTNSYVRDLLPALQKGDATRTILLKQILEQLNITTSKQDEQSHP